MPSFVGSSVAKPKKDVAGFHDVILHSTKEAAYFSSIGYQRHFKTIA
jgi:hypothetical protein